ncbi:MAG: hypothetical protein AAF610_08520 [Pseudomonadota bacterium]
MRSIETARRRVEGQVAALAIVAFAGGLAAPTALAQLKADKTAESAEETKLAAQRSDFRHYRRRPFRASQTLRYENLSDIEVRDIRSITQSLHPGAIVNISGVTLHCPCEDGPDCSAQVGVVAYTDTSSKRYLFSKINDHWEIGPLLDWWLAYDAMRKAYREDTGNPGIFVAHDWSKLLDQLNERYPFCKRDPPE